MISDLGYSPLIVVPQQQAVQNIKSKDGAYWSSTVGRAFAGRLTPFIQKKTLMTAADPVFAIGSCFAAEIERALGARCFSVLSSPSGFAELSDGVLFRYNVPSMLAEFRRCLVDPAELPETDLVVQTDDGRFRDCHYAAMIPLDSMEAITQRREIARSVFSRIKEAKVVVLTLGLNEMWYDQSCGEYLNTWSDLNLINSRSALETRVLSASHNLAYLNEIYKVLLDHVGPHIQVVVTVSPVALYATFTDDDVLVANMRSKMILRAAAEEFAANHPNVHYFPSWEIAMCSEPSTVFEPDGRHVTRAMADHIVQIFIDRHVA